MGFKCPQSPCLNIYVLMECDTFFFSSFFLILHDIMNQSLVATTVNLWCYVCVMNNAEVSWF